jgi:hypothetical protein
MPIHTAHTLVSSRRPDIVLIRFLVCNTTVDVFACTRDMGGSWAGQRHSKFWNAPNRLRYMTLPKEGARDAWRMMRKEGWIDSSELPEDELRKLQNTFPHPLNGAVA